MRRGISYSLATLATVGSLLAFGCSEPTKPDFLGEHETIPEKAVSILQEERPIPNQDLIYDGVLPIYENPFEVLQENEHDRIFYTARYTNPNHLKKSLEEQLSGAVDVISVIGNQLALRVPNTEGRLSNDGIRKIIEKIDVKQPQIMVNVRVVRVFADYTEDIGNLLKLLHLD